MDLRKLIWHLNNVKINYGLMFIAVAVFQCFTYIIFNVDFEIILNGDAKFYIGSLENLYQTGTYEYNGSFSGRMPGFMPLYTPLRILFSQQITLVLMVFLQLIFYSYAIVFFTRRISETFNWGTISQMLIILLLGLTNYVSAWGNVFYTESLAVSSLLMGVGYILIFQNKTNYTKLIYAGIFFTWLIFLRPFMTLFVFSILIYLCFNFKKDVFRILIYLAIPFVLFESIWILRNYNQEGRFIPAQGTIYAGNKPPESFFIYRKMIACFGGDATDWNPNSEGMWFQTDEYLKENGFSRPSIDIFTDRIFNKSFRKDSLVKLRESLWKTKKTNQTEIEIIENQKEFNSKALGFISNYKSSHPFDYYLGSKFTLLYKFLKQPYTYYLSMDQHYSKIQFLIKVMIYVINAFIIIFGTICLVINTLFTFRKTSKSFKLLLLAIPYLIFFIFPIVLGVTEYRFLVLAIPIFVILISITLGMLESNKKY